MKIGIVGDHDARSETHQATTAALHHAAPGNSPVDVTWLGTAGLERHGVDMLTRFDGLVIAPGSRTRA